MEQDPTEDMFEELQPPADESASAADEMVAPTPAISTPPIVDSPPSAADAILALKADGDFLGWAISETIAFLDLADLPRVKTAEALRVHKEEAIRTKIQIANSVLVLAANYGSVNDDEALVKACELYAEKMRTIIKRVCL